MTKHEHIWTFKGKKRGYVCYDCGLTVIDAPAEVSGADPVWAIEGTRED